MRPHDTPRHSQDSLTHAENPCAHTDAPLPSAAARPETAPNRGLLALLTVGAALVVGVTGMGVARYWISQSGLRHTAGVWTGLAMDVADGVFYRPLVGEHGFGGTRYLPLQFLIHGAAVHAGADPITSGHVLSVVFTVMLVAGTFRLLRNSGVTTAVAAPCACLVLCGYSVQIAAITIRGDVLAAALNVWGLAMVASACGQERRGGHLAWAAVCFVLAFTAKFTTLFGWAGACVSLWLIGRRRDAVKLFGWTVVGVVVCLVVIHVASEGRALESFTACASGGTTIGRVLRSPMYLLRTLRQDRVGMVFALLAGAALLSAGRGAWRELPTWATVFTLGVTLLLLSSPGTEYNHLIDAQVIAVVLFTVQVARGRVSRGFGVAALACVGFLAAGYFYVFAVNHRCHQGLTRRKQIAMLLAHTGAGDAPILSDDPMLAVADGRRPYMLDPFMFRLLEGKDPGFGRELAAKLRVRAFRAVVLQGTRFLGPDLLVELNHHYRRVLHQGRYSVYRVRASARAAPPTSVSTPEQRPKRPFPLHSRGLRNSDR